MMGQQGRVRAIAALMVLVIAVLHGPAVARGSDSSQVAIYEVKKAVRLVQVAEGAFRFSRSLRFGPAARDGGAWWYLVRIRMKLELNHGPVRSPIELTASVNHLTANRVELERRPSAGCRGPKVLWNSVDLLSGYREWVSCRPKMVVKSMNFTQLHAIRPGPAPFIVQAVGALGADDSVTLLPGSGVIRSQKGPAKLVFAPIRSGGGFPVGSWTKMPFELVNRGDRRVGRILVGTDADRRLAIKRRAIRIPGFLEPHNRASRALWVKPLRAGQFELRLFASSTANHPGVEVSVRTGAESSSGDGEVRDGAMVVVMVGLAGLVLLWGWEGMSVNKWRVTKR